MKSLVEETLDLIQRMRFVFERLETILGKGKNAGYLHVFIFPKYFQKSPSSGLQKSGLYGKGLVKNNFMYDKFMY